ncbi:MAG: hypothetical protein WCY15_16345 [Phenylobacterium sp.]|jgi:hypothetical protein|uniref:hypothetical protein n=1 Tax=Phenylobacterium sp. TaxID=1871053 RepID=UPI002A27710A|nr:hypothetical protein [Phenylobacterium sp.]MDD3837274.1 hypothetical protein [Phenylobacterium sp.]MDX9999313.1 hypothetical protein [Phenylobacterium sp.]
MARREMQLVVGGRLPKIPVAVFSTREQAEAYCARHSAWYGADHPLNPLEVRPIEVDPEPAALADPPGDSFRRPELRPAAVGHVERHVGSASPDSPFGQVLQLRT